MTVLEIEEASLERRRKPRIYVPFPARVQGTDCAGQPFDVQTVLDNLSGNSLYLRMMLCVLPGEQLNVSFNLSLADTDAGEPAKIKIRGKVLRTDEYPGDVCGIALAFEHPKFT
jgi:PilZ domain